MEHRTIRGVHFLHLRGDTYERGRAHARFLKNEIASGAMPALAKKNKWIIRRAPRLAEFGPIQEAVNWFYENVVVPRLHRSTALEQREILRIVSEESGIPLKVMTLGYFQADGLMYMFRKSLLKHLMPELPSGGLPGCTSAIALKGWTKNGRLLVARNMDYPIVGPWEGNPTVSFHEPTEKNEIPHVSITSAGLITSGLTAMNREGLTLASHAHFGKTFRFGGHTVFAGGTEIIRRARTIGEAVDIARKQRFNANWAFVIASAKENDAVVIEVTPDDIEIRSTQDGLLAHTNYFQSRLHNEEALISGACCDDLERRVCRMRELLSMDQGRLEPTHMARALGDHMDSRFGIERVYGSTVSVVTTVTSVVMEPESQKFWVSCRLESPTGLGDFLEVSIDKFWESDLKELPFISGARPRSPGLMEAIEHYREAYRWYHVNNDDPNYSEKSLVALRKAVRAYPLDGHLWIQVGLLAFKHQSFAEAKHCFYEAHQRPMARHMVLVSRLMLARCYDILGERDASVKLYATHFEVEEPRLKKAFLTGLRRPYRVRETKLLHLDLQFPDLIQY